MADVLIKGLDMPTKGNPLTVLIYPDGTATWKDHEYQAVHVPPHGRLIEADALKKKHHWTDDFYETEYVEVEDIDAAPTIIPASEEGRKEDI